MPSIAKPRSRLDNKTHIQNISKEHNKTGFWIDSEQHVRMAPPLTFDNAVLLTSSSLSVRDVALGKIHSYAPSHLADNKRWECHETTTVKT